MRLVRLIGRSIPIIKFASVNIYVMISEAVRGGEYEMTVFWDVWLCSLYILTDVSEVLTDAIIRPMSLQSVSTRLHGATSQKTAVFSCLMHILFGTV
jgi:hypothetical protein